MTRTTSGYRRAKAAPTLLSCFQTETPSRDTQPTSVEQSTRQSRERIEANHCRTVTRHRSVPTDATATIQTQLYQPCQLPLAENKRGVEHMTALPLRNLTL